MAKLKDIAVGSKGKDVTMRNYIEHLMSIYNREEPAADENVITKHHDTEAGTELSEESHNKKRLFQERPGYTNYENGGSKI